MPIEKIISITGLSKEEIEIRDKALTSFQHRLINKDEFKIIRNMIEEYDFEYLFYQELTSDTDWLPDFNKFQPFFSASFKSFK